MGWIRRENKTLGFLNQRRIRLTLQEKKEIQPCPDLAQLQEGIDRTHPRYHLNIWICLNLRKSIYVKWDAFRGAFPWINLASSVFEINALEFWIDWIGQQWSWEEKYSLQKSKTGIGRYKEARASEKAVKVKR